MASINMPLLIDAGADIATKTANLVLKWAVRVFGTAFTLQTSAMLLHDQIARTPEDVLRDMGYRPELLTKPDAENINIRILEHNLLGQIRLYNRMQATSLAIDNPSIPMQVWEYAAAIEPRTPRTLSSFYNHFYTGTIAALPVQSTHQTALILTGHEKNFERGSVITTKDGQSYSIFDSPDFKDMNALALLHEWDHAAKPILTLPYKMDIVHAKEIEADFYALDAFRQLSKNDYTQKWIDFRILRAFYGIYGQGPSDYPHDTALSIEYRRTGKSVTQAEVKKAYSNIHKGYSDMSDMGMDLPGNLATLAYSAFYLRKNFRHLRQLKNISARDAEIMTDTLDLLEKAALRLDEKGPIQKPKPRQRYILSDQKPTP